MPQTTKKKKMSGNRRDAISLIVLALVAIVALYVFSCQAQDRLPFFGKYALVRITTSSMEPEISTGAYVLIEKLSAEEKEELKKGEIVIFNSRDPSILGKLNTHRIYSVEDGEYVTKGDNDLTNPLPDKYRVIPSDIQGRYVRTLATLTAVMSYMGDHLVLVLALLSLILIIYFLLATASDIMEKKRKGAEELSADVIERIKKDEDMRRELEARVAAEVERLKRERAELNGKTDDNKTEDKN